LIEINVEGIGTLYDEFVTIRCKGGAWKAFALM
jgi:hypothetical protein